MPTRSLSLAIQSRVRQGALLNIPAWALLPEWAIPENGISLLTGREFIIYGESLINLIVPIPANYTVTYTCSIGTQSSNDFVVTPAVSDIGSKSLNILIKLGSYIICNYTINLNIYCAPEVNLGSKKILAIGDSLTQLGIDGMKTSLDSVMSNTTLTFVGTQGTTVKHEGRGGWVYFLFATDGSPFYKSGAINIAAYFTDNSITVPDVIFFNLGVNESYVNCRISDDHLTYAEIITIINYAKSLIDAFLAYNANYKIIIAIPSICEDTGAGWNANYDESVYSQNIYIENIHNLWMSLISTFANSAYNARVSVCYPPLFLDRNNGYQKTNGIHTNGVHPATSGYNQMGVGMALGINAVMNRFISSNGIPSASSNFTTNGVAWWYTRGGSTTKEWNAAGYMTISSPSVSGFISGILTGMIFKLSAKYRFSFSIRSSNYTGHMVIQLGGVNIFVYPTVTSSWQVLSGFGTMSPTYNNFAILCADAFNGSFDIDDIIIQEVDNF